MSDIPDILILYPKSKIEALERTARVDASIAKQLSQSMSINARLQTRIQKLETALQKSVELQSHYAELLNAYDGGQRLQFENGDAWIVRLERPHDDDRQ